MTTGVRVRSVVLALAFVGAAAGRAHAQSNRYALLVGVGRYASPAIRTLEGPAFDAQAVRAELTGRWGFPAANVRMLIDQQATRQNILGGLDWLVAQSKPGDIVLIFYSGHGTSRQNRSQLQYALHPATGAIFPYDVATDSEDHALNTLIVGRRDLRPRLERLDDGRQVLVVIDSCYSRNATRALAVGRGQTKAQPLFGELEGFASPVAPEPYPYQNIVSLSAASEAEEAVDIGYSVIREGVETIDGRPKGALTDALLRGLRGDANRVAGGTLTLGELFQFVRQEVTSRFSHTPQLVLPGGRAELAAQPLFGLRAAATPVPAAPAAALGPLRVRLEDVTPVVAQQISAMPGVVASASGAYDVRLGGAGGWLRLYDRSGDLIESYPAGEARALVARLERERYARRLINLSPAMQEFIVSVDLPSNTGVLQSGKSYTLICDVGAPAVVLVLDLDKTGMLSVLAPAGRADLAPATHWSFPVRVDPPEGTEFIKVFAFRRPPAWLEAWVGVAPQPANGARVQDLLARLASGTEGVAEARLKVVTVK